MNKGRVIFRCITWLIVAMGGVFLFFAAKYLYWDKDDKIQEEQRGAETCQGYSYVTIEREAVNEGPLILVNNSNNYGFTQLDEMVTVTANKNDCYKVKDNNQKLNVAVMEPLNSMMKDFTEAKGKTDIIVVSAYRSFEEQERIYSNKVLEGDSKALQWVTIPGCSEHHTGYALDFGLYTSSGDSYNFNGKGIYSYILDNAYKYGFILRYPEDKTEITSIYYEAWHFRYIGRPHAYIAESNNMCLEEYIEYLKSFPFEEEHLNAEDFDGTKYEIYYVKAENGQTKVPVPRDRKYYISGNNVDGFIVTAYMQ